jgi:hypothetical protein
MAMAAQQEQASFAMATAANIVGLLGGIDALTRYLGDVAPGISVSPPGVVIRDVDVPGNLTHVIRILADHDETYRVQVFGSLASGPNSGVLPMAPLAECGGVEAAGVGEMVTYLSGLAMPRLRPALSIIERE